MIEQLVADGLAAIVATPDWPTKALTGLAAAAGAGAIVLAFLAGARR